MTVSFDNYLRFKSSINDPEEVNINIINSLIINEKEETYDPKILTIEKNGIKFGNINLKLNFIDNFIFRFK
jgi:hypothetical protein